MRFTLCQDWEVMVEVVISGAKIKSRGFKEFRRLRLRYAFLPNIMKLVSEEILKHICYGICSYMVN